MDCTICVAKTKVLISFAVTAKLICVFVFAFAKIRFSHDAAHLHPSTFNFRGNMSNFSFLFWFLIYSERQKSCTIYIFAIFLQIENFFEILVLLMHIILSTLIFVRQICRL